MEGSYLHWTAAGGKGKAWVLVSDWDDLDKDTDIEDDDEL